jgi:hypothetical protein
MGKVYIEVNQMTKDESIIQQFREKFPGYFESAYYEKEDANLQDELESFWLSKLEEQREEDLKKFESLFHYMNNGYHALSADIKEAGTLLKIARMVEENEKAFNLIKKDNGGGDE